MPIQFDTIKGMEIHDWNDPDRVIVGEVTGGEENAGLVIVHGTSPNGLFPVEAAWAAGDLVIDQTGEIGAKVAPVRYDIGMDDGS